MDEIEKEIIKVLEEDKMKAERRLVVLHNLLDDKRRPIILALLGYKGKV